MAANLGTILGILALLWLEFAGIYHAFVHVGLGPGLAAIFVPPYAWYQTFAFMVWLLQGKGF